MSKPVVIFGKDGLGARRYPMMDKLPDGALVSPDVGHLKGVSPSHWKKTAVGIVEMTAAEKLKTYALPLVPAIKEEPHPFEVKLESLWEHTHALKEQAKSVGLDQASAWDQLNTRVKKLESRPTLPPLDTVMDIHLKNILKKQKELELKLTALPSVSVGGGQFLGVPPKQVKILRRVMFLQWVVIGAHLAFEFSHHILR